MLRRGIKSCFILCQKNLDVLTYDNLVEEGRLFLQFRTSDSSGENDREHTNSEKIKLSAMPHPKQANSQHHLENKTIAII
jgi:hypothetical protein